MITRRRITVAVLLAAIFALGAAAGRFSSAWTSHDNNPIRSDRSPRAGPPGARFVATMERELKLTPMQRDSVQAILRKWDPAMRGVWDAMQVKFDSLRVLVRADIRQVLTDDQKAAFQRWTVHADSVRNRQREAERAR
jgi:Spy/CpxP family protein refolding chaperone